MKPVDKPIHRLHRVHQAAVEEWSNIPSTNPRYHGATPYEVGRALLRKSACHAEEKIAHTPVPVKSRV